MLANSPFGLYRYNIDTDTWQTGIAVTYQGPLFDLSLYEVLNMTGLPVGTYAFYFGVDLVMDGAIDYDQLYYDRVVVIVE